MRALPLTLWYNPPELHEAVGVAMLPQASAELLVQLAPVVYAAETPQHPLRKYECCSALTAVTQNKDLSGPCCSDRTASSTPAAAAAQRC